MPDYTRHCTSCGQENETNTELAIGLCRDCASKTPGEAKACPSCGCPLVKRMPNKSEGHEREWEWNVTFGGRTSNTQIHYCPEHGCDLEAEFHLARRAKKAGQG